MGEALPKARCANLILEQLHEELLVYDLDRHKAHCLGPLAAAVWQACDGTNSLVALERALRQRTPQVDGPLVRLTLERLDEAHLLEPLGIRRRQLDSGSRRALLRSATAVGLAVFTITVPTAALAASCLPTGTCVSSQCLNAGLRCCQGTCHQLAGQCGVGQFGFVCD